MIYERIEKSLNQAIKLHNSGLSANESVIKVAREHELNPETISRVVEAFNIAKTKAYVKVAQDKAADFDIADKKEVIKSVFADEPVSKTASEQTGASFLKIASTSDEPEEEFVVSRTSEVPLEARIKMAYQAIEEQNRELTEKRQSVVECKEDFYNGLKTATDLLEYHNERESLSKYAAEIFYQHAGDDRAGKIFSLTCKCAGIDPEKLTDKVGGAHGYGGTEFIEAFDRMLDADSRYTQESSHYNESVRECSEKQAELKSLVFRAGNAISKEGASSFIGSGIRTSKKAASFREMPEDLLNDVLGSLFDEPKPAKKASESKSASGMLKFSDIAEVVSGPSRIMKSVSEMAPSSSRQVQDLANKGYLLNLQGKGSPVREQKAKGEMEDMEREMILRDLMRDEIISQQDPQDIENTYNAMVQLAPNASMIKDIVRSVLRQGTAQVIDPHFANTLVDLENNILKTKSLVSGKGDQNKGN